MPSRYLPSETCGQNVGKRCRITVDPDGRLWNRNSASDLRVYRRCRVCDSPTNGPKVFLITQRSQVQILPPLQSEPQVSAGFVGYHGPGSCVQGQPDVC